MDDFDYSGGGCGGHDCFNHAPAWEPAWEPAYEPPVDHFAESYNPATTDLEGIMIRQAREMSEQAVQAAIDWSTEQGQQAMQAAASMSNEQLRASPLYAPPPKASWGVVRRYEQEQEWHALFCQHADTGAPDTYRPAVFDPKAERGKIIKEKGRTFYTLPGEPDAWRRPSTPPDGKRDHYWWMRFKCADECSTKLAKWSGYTGWRDEFGWIRPTFKEILKMGPGLLRRYAAAHAHFATYYVIKMPLWVRILGAKHINTSVFAG